MTAIALALLANRRAMMAVIREVLDNRAVLFVLGLISMFVGLLIVLTHNVWSGSALDVLVTLIGWLFILRGALIFFLPHGMIRKLFNAIKFAQTYYVIAIIALIVGIYLAWNGFLYT